MDVSAITTLISSLGFPIVCCIAMYLQNNKQEVYHKEEVQKLSEAINNNTNVMVQLIEKIKGN